MNFEWNLRNFYHLDADWHEFTHNLLECHNIDDKDGKFQLVLENGQIFDEGCGWLWRVNKNTVGVATRVVDYFREIPVVGLIFLDHDHVPEFSEFDRWWKASKYCQVILDNPSNRQIALDAWNASRKVI